MRTTDPVTRRLAPLVAAYFFGGVALWVPVEKLFLSEIGFTPETIGVMAAAYAGVVPLLEVPSGILADRWSRRGVLVVGNVGAFVSVLIGALSASVGVYVVAAVFLGVYFAMQSGTFDAVVYDTVLEETGSSERFERTIGRVRLAESVSFVLSALAGGAIAAATEPRVAYVATLPFIVVSTIFLLAFREPRLHEGGERRSLREHVALTVTTLGRERRLLPIAALLVLTGLLTQGLFEFGPLWLVDGDAGADAHGLAWAGLMASLGLGGLVAGRVRFERPRTVAVVAGVLLVSGATLTVARHLVVVTVAQVSLALVAVALGIFVTRLLHDAISSDVRAGVASGVGALTWMVFLPFALGFGSITEALGVRAAGWLVLLLAAGVAALLGTVALGVRRSAPVQALPAVPCPEHLATAA